MQQYINSNLSPREVFRIYGTLPDNMIEDLLDTQDAADATCGASPYIEEAMTMYPGEDFIDQEGVFDDLRAIAASVRGDNRKAVQAVIEKLEGLQLGVSRQSEYGIDELRKALKSMEGA